MYLLIAAMAALCFYLASPHQRLLPRATAHAPRLRIAACVACIAAVGLADAELGLLAGFFAAQTAFMLVLVMLPYLDLWRRTRHVG